MPRAAGRRLPSDVVAAGWNTCVAAIILHQGGRRLDWTRRGSRTAGSFADASGTAARRKRPGLGGSRRFQRAEEVPRQECTAAATPS